MKPLSVCGLRIKQSRRISRRMTLWVGAVFLFVLGGCGLSERPDIGTRLDSPIALTSHPTLAVYYVLNASLSGEFQTGSLQSYSVPTTTGATTSPSTTLKTPRLGTALAAAKGGEFLVAGFSGSEPELRIYSLNAQGNPTESTRDSDKALLPTGRVGTIQVNAVNGQTGVWSIVVSLSDRSTDAKVVIYKYAQSTGLTRLAVVPSDFYSPSRDNPLGSYAMAWGVPVVFPSQGIIAAFPQGTLGYFGKNPSAFDWLSGKVDATNPLFDLRTISALVIDLNALLNGQSIQQSIGFVPVAFNATATKANTATAADLAGNLDYQFRTAYQSSYAIDPLSAPCQMNGPYAQLPQSTAVVAMNSETADLVALSGWDQVATQLRTRLAAGTTQPILGDILTPSPVSLTSGITSLSGIRTLVPAIQIVNSGSVCTLSWLRVEQFRSSLGREIGRIQVATDTSAVAQLSRDTEVTGVASFTVNGSSIMAGSFSNNKIQVLRFNGSNFDNLGVFSP